MWPIKKKKNHCEPESSKTFHLGTVFIFSQDTYIFNYSVLGVKIQLTFKNIHCVYVSLSEKKLDDHELRVLEAPPQRGWLFWKHVVRGWGSRTEHYPLKPVPERSGPHPVEEQS